MHVVAVNQNMFNIEFSILPKIGVPIYSMPSLKLTYSPPLCANQVSART